MNSNISGNRYYCTSIRLSTAKKMEGTRLANVAVGMPARACLQPVTEKGGVRQGYAYGN